MYQSLQYSSIPGNEAADREALRGASLPLQSHMKQMSVAGAKRWARTVANQDLSAYQDSQSVQQRLRQDCARLLRPAELRLLRES